MWKKSDIKMITFPCCKINIGLSVLNKRPDGYHDIRTLMYPVRGLCDSLEILPDPESEECRLSFSGIVIDCPVEKTSVWKAWRVMRERYGIGGVKAHLHKAVPFGAGLGGGSADGGFAVRMLNEIFGLGLSESEMEDAAATIGSDDPFFVRCTPRVCAGRGEVLIDNDLDLSGKWIAILKPPYGISTAQAYGGVTPAYSTPIEEITALPIEEWRRLLKNDFEQSAFALHPELAEIKEELYRCGAEYAAMSGSGSAMYGLFSEKPSLSPSLQEIAIYQGEL